MTAFSIRPATPADVPHILDMITELADFERLRHLVVADEGLLRDALFGAHPACECVVAREGDTPVAFALFFHNFSTFLAKKGLYLEDLYVKLPYRGKGYATQILKHLARLAVERNCGRFEWSVLDWNEKAIGFYKKMGADVMPDWRICRVTGEGLTQLAA
ncbi:GNAT family N-acetyltransferase [Oxalobacteraceae bacterium OM1]|nr:GNAT family N-acetyltransferase [Oxalobacteraceae bacterium OM1]